MESVLLQIGGGTTVIRPNQKYIMISRKINFLKDQFDQGKISASKYLEGISFNISNPIGL